MRIRFAGMTFILLVLATVGGQVFAQGHYHNVPHTTTHYDTYRHGGHYHTVPHTTTHTDSVYHADPVYYPNYVTPAPSQVYIPNSTVISQPAVATIPNVSSTTTTKVLKPNTIPYKGRGVTIRLPEDVGGEISYIIDRTSEAEISAGMEQVLDKKRSYEVRFSRGVSEEGIDLGEARYTLTEGVYHFTVTEKGWDLFRQREERDDASLSVPRIAEAKPKLNKLPKAPMPSQAIASE